MIEYLQAQNRTPGVGPMSEVGYGRDSWKCDSLDLQLLTLPYRPHPSIDPGDPRRRFVGSTLCETNSVSVTMYTLGASAYVVTNYGELNPDED